MAIFVAALALRALFWQATPDRGWLGSVLYQGDAGVWLEWASALERGEPFELGLPLRPPGAAYLMSWIGEATGAGVAGLRLLWCLLGAATVYVLYRAALRSFGLAVAVGVGLLTTASFGLLVLTTSLNNETPYLFLVALLLWLASGLAARPRAGALLAWGALNGLACLFRVEHAIFFGLASVWAAATWWRSDGVNRAAVNSVQVGMAFCVALLPWHVAAWREVGRFNSEAPLLAPAVEDAQRSLEQLLTAVTWSEPARHEADAMPAFARRTAVNFVSATVAHRGRSRVEAEDLAILDEAFGYRPRALSEHPFVVLSGGLNFALANQRVADGGFSRAALEAPPPLAGGRERYPSLLVEGLPPPDLALTYPPHLRLVNEGYGVGWRWLTGRPGRAWILLGAKLRRFWSGAALGWTGYDLPLGASGRREPVDLVVPRSLRATISRLVLLVGAGLGLVFAWRRPEATPWLLFLGCKVLVTLAFYGYARQGASVIPVIALLVVLAIERWLPTSADVRRWRWIAFAGCALVVGVEAARWSRPPEVWIDGQPITAAPMRPGDDHGPHEVRFR